MASLENNDLDYTEIGRREIAASGIGVSPRGIASYESLQRAAFTDAPAASAAAQGTANQAVTDAGVADGKAEEAQGTAEFAQGTADTAMGRADDAYDLADTKVTKDLGPVFAAPAGSVSRAALPAYAAGTAGVTYTATDVQGLMDQVAALTTRLAAAITDLRGNGALTP